MKKKLELLLLFQTYKTVLSSLQTCEVIQYVNT